MTPESLTSWYRDFCAGRTFTGSDPASRKPKKPKAKLKPKPEEISQDCILCGIRRVASGNSKASRYARKAHLCGYCYNRRGVMKSGKAAKIAKNGLCVRCGKEPIAAGKSRHAARAQIREICWTCLRMEAVNK